MSDIENAETDAEHLHRHAWRAWEDFCRLRKLARSANEDEVDLWHSLSHHIRNTVWRSGQEVSPRGREYVRRSVR